MTSTPFYNIVSFWILTQMAPHTLQPFQSLYELQKQLAKLQDSFAKQKLTQSIYLIGNRNLSTKTTCL